MATPGEDMYNDGADEAPALKSGDTEGKDESDAKTSILPRDFFHGDMKPGDKCDVEIVAVHENEVEVKPCEGHEDEGGEAPAPAPAPQEGSMASLME